MHCHRGNESAYFKKGFLSQSHNLPSPSLSCSLPVSHEHNLPCLLDNKALHFFKHVTACNLDCELMSISHCFVKLPCVQQQYTAS